MYITEHFLVFHYLPPPFCSSDWNLEKMVTKDSPLFVSFLTFKHIYFTSIEKQVLTTYTNLSRFCFLGTTPVLAPNVWANEKISKLTPAPGNRTRDLKIARSTLYLTTTDTTCIFPWIHHLKAGLRQCLTKYTPNFQHNHHDSIHGFP